MSMLPKCAIVLRNRRFDGGAIGDVRRDGNGLAAFARDDGRGFLCGFLHQVDAGNMGPFPCIGGGRSLAVAPARPRGPCPEHDGGLALQAINHALLPFPESVPRAQRLRCHAVHFAGSHSSRVTSNVMQIGFEPAMKGPP